MSVFTDLTFASADDRRKIAKAYRSVLPGDFAALTAAILRGNPHASVPEADTRTSHTQTVPVLGRRRILTALVEPNTLAMARNYSIFPRHGQVTRGQDGVFEVRWATVGDHEAVYRDAYTHYRDTHEVVGEVTKGSRLDSWHSPLLLIPVRHTYDDGTAPMTVWMCADGNARLWGARAALAADLTRWGLTHPWTNPGTRWDLSMAEVRTVVAAARQHARTPGRPTTATATGTGTGSQAAASWAVCDGSVEDWADLLLPGAFSGKFHDLGTYLYQVHNRAEDEPSPFVEDSHAWVASIDVFTGRDPFDLLGLNPADPEDREQVTEDTAAIHADLLTAVTNKDATARRVTLAAVAAAQQATAAGHPVLADPDQQVTFRQWLITATSQTRGLFYDANETIMGLIRDLLALRPLPDCDLYGIGQDLANNSLYDPLDDPASPWFTTTTLRGLVYAILHGHLHGEAIPPSPAYTAARDAQYAADQAAEEAAAEAGTEVDWDTHPDLLDTPALRAEERDRAFFKRLPDNLLHRLLTTPEGHQVILGYAHDACTGVVPSNRFTNRATGAGQVVHLTVPDQATQQ